MIEGKDGEKIEVGIEGEKALAEVEDVATDDESDFFPGDSDDEE